MILGEKKEFVLASSGHVAGVINPPHKKKYGYLTNLKKTKKAENFFESSTFHPGSWWNHWNHWLKQYSGNLYSVNHPSIKSSKELEPVPGSYVKVRLSNIEKIESSRIKECLQS